MKIIKISSTASRDELMAMLEDNEAVNKNVTFQATKGTPHIHLREKGKRIRLTCEFVGGATKDNAFLDGTRFIGKITDDENGSTVKGVITTAPIFHAVLIALFAAFVVMCIIRQGFNVVPLCLVAFDVFMYWNEFKKQGIIERYLKRAVKRLEARKNGLSNE